MSQLKISELESTTSVNEELCNVPVDDGTSTKKITLKNLMASATASAQAYAEAAAGSASDASGYATAASTSASDASGYATSAGTSATNAAGSASAASGYADTASAAASTASGSASSAASSANNAAQQVSNAENYSKLSESYAHGNTGVRAGENTDNAKYWAQVAAAAAGGGVVTFNGRSGAVVPENGDYNADQISRGTTSTVDADLTSLEQNKENKAEIKTQTLAAGSTTVTFTNMPTTGTHLVKFYNSAGINYSEIDNSTSGQVTLKFMAQEAAVTVYCEIREVS